MKAANTVVLIDTDRNNLSRVEGAIKSIDPNLMCISFVFADEALAVMDHELKHIPKFIVIDLNLSRMSGAECLARLRTQRIYDNSRIVVFSVVMPPIVADTFKSMGANYAFQKPLSDAGYREVLSEVLTD